MSHPPDAMPPSLLGRLAQALAPLPTDAGGTVLVLATAAQPPSLAVLSTGDVALVEDRILIAVHASSSAVARAVDTFSVLVPARDEALRVEVVDAATRSAGALAVLHGTVAAIRPTAEAGWTMDMAFRPGTGAATSDFIAFWRAVRRWLEGGAEGDSPRPPLPV